MVDTRTRRIHTLRCGMRKLRFMMLFLCVYVFVFVHSAHRLKSQNRRRKIMIITQNEIGAFWHQAKWARFFFCRRNKHDTCQMICMVCGWIFKAFISKLKWDRMTEWVNESSMTARVNEWMRDRRNDREKEEKNRQNIWMKKVHALWETIPVMRDEKHFFLC